MATTSPGIAGTLPTAVGEFLAPANQQTCLLIVEKDVRLLESTAAALLASHGWPRLPVGPELSAALLHLSPPQRPRAVPRWLTDRLAGSARSPVLCTDIDLLFEPSLELDPLTLLKRAGRVARLVVAWPGSYAGDVLTYAVPEHGHYRTWRRPEAAVVTLT